MGGLSNREYRTLSSESHNTAVQLSPGIIEIKPKQVFFHHAKVLTEITNHLNPLKGKQRLAKLHAFYCDAMTMWPEVEDTTGTGIGARRWITPLLEGLNLFAKSEGWQLGSDSSI